MHVYSGPALLWLVLGEFVVEQLDVVVFAFGQHHQTTIIRPVGHKVDDSLNAMYMRAERALVDVRPRLGKVVAGFDHERQAMNDL